MLISKACTNSQGVLILEVLVPSGPPVLVDETLLVSEGCLTTSEYGIRG